MGAARRRVATSLDTAAEQPPERTWCCFLPAASLPLVREAETGGVDKLAQSASACCPRKIKHILRRGNLRDPGRRGACRAIADLEGGGGALLAFLAPRKALVEMRTWTRDEAVRYPGHVADDRLFAMWRLFLTTRMRPGEVAALRWGDLDLDAARVSIRQTGNVIDRVQTVGTPRAEAEGRPGCSA